jgi:hypothetical protein
MSNLLKSEFYHAQKNDLYIEIFTLALLRKNSMNFILRIKSSFLSGFIYHSLNG